MIFITVSICAAYDNLIFAPADPNAVLRLYDSPAAGGIVNAEIQAGGILRVIEREGDSLLLVNEEDLAGWVKLDLKSIERDFKVMPAAPAQEGPLTRQPIQALQDLNQTLPPENARLKIIVSLKGLTMHVRCEKENFDKVYPVGVGVKDSHGRSFTPTCQSRNVAAFRTHFNAKNKEFFMEHRYSPSHFGGFPFIRLNILNSDQDYTYGMHGPITQKTNGAWYLQRGFVSHGCMRMRPEDAIELYKLSVANPAASLVIQEDFEYDQNGKKVDVDYPLWRGITAEQ